MNGSNQPLNKAQLICISTLISKLGLQGQKDALIQGFTDGRTESRKDMWRDEAAALIKYLKSIDPDEASAEKMRRYIISMARSMKWLLPGNKADMPRIDNWCKAYGYLHKGLNAYTLQELPRLVTQFQAVYKSHLRGI